MTESHEVQQKIRNQIKDNAIVLYMKGTPQQPQCGFSAQTVQILSTYGRPFAFVNVLDNLDIRSNLPQVSQWPTFPQLFVQGELVGGCDIVTEMHNNGELKTLLETVTDQA